MALKGCPDTDKDGILDKNDSCVTEPGLAEFYGCPDRDSDKIPDKLDLCPDIPGLAKFKGCPDKDGDGVEDRFDKCPDIPGDTAHFGCPDTDGDGLYDYEDNCIQVKGPRENKGCPYPDRDGDGVYDRDDACIDVFGVAENKGCPMLEKKEIETVKTAFENLEFETGKDIIRTSSYASLNSLAMLLVKKANYGLRIEGHTDNVGSDSNNLILSQKRATAVKNYLKKKGVEGNKLEDFGYGESKPIATNDTPEGRQKNRRVEMTITFR
ncbi:MAG: OmpA family protein [Bacteroidetes bacterium]|nr:OmpA family protein [Bacteroidota bacterium]